MPSILFVVFSDLSLLTLLSVVLEGVLQLVTSLLGVLGDAQLQIHQLLEFRILSWIHATLSTQYLQKVSSPSRKRLPVHTLKIYYKRVFKQFVSTLILGP